jgi:hypothetical protein
MTSNKSFGIVFAVFFLILTIYYFLSENLDISVLFIILSISFLVLGLNKSKILTPLNIVWTKFGFLLGKFISPIIIAIIYFFIIFPTKLLLILLKKDNLMIGNKFQKSYWKSYDSNSNLNNQF